MAETPICVWCNKPIAISGDLPADRVNAILMHCTPAAPCLLEYAHDVDDVELCFNAAMKLIEMARGDHAPSSGLTPNAPATEWCAGALRS